MKRNHSRLNSGYNSPAHASRMNDDQSFLTDLAGQLCLDANGDFRAERARSCSPASLILSEARFAIYV